MRNSVALMVDLLMLPLQKDNLYLYMYQSVSCGTITITVTITIVQSYQVNVNSTKLMITAHRLPPSS